ncbi:MAG: hypothetical protein K1X79_13275 [Oligoflexia bacterium]|nr:hypothetical protein [Oligoflexia bacterium]
MNKLIAKTMKTLVCLVGMSVSAFAQDLRSIDPACLDLGASDYSSESLSLPHGLQTGTYDCEGNGREYLGMIEVTGPLEFTLAPRSPSGKKESYVQSSTVNGTNSVGFKGSLGGSAITTINTDGTFKIDFITSDGGRYSYICRKK